MKNIAFPEMSPIELTEKGQLQLSLDHAAKEVDKLHTLRVGSAGCLVDGEFIGANPYVTLARFLGFGTKKTLGTYNIFDTGYANEYSWEANLNAAGVAFLTEEEYPVQEMVGKYKLTGRPDLVLGNYQSDPPQFNATAGVELKAICSSNTMKLFTSEDPKTENLIQAAAYSMYLKLPWTLAYSAGFNHFGNRAGKIEFPLSWREGKLLFERPSGEIVETLITQQGIRDYYTAIIEAFETKDHSWFKRANSGYNGQEVQYWDDYDEFLLAVDSALPWDDWIRACEIATASDWIVQLKRRKGCKDRYFLEHTQTREQSMMFSTLKGVRDELRKTIS